jgi:hypothetical protein
MENLIKRKHGLFIIDQNQLKPKANKTSIINALYGSLYLEFRGANTNPSYCNMTPLEKMQAVNIFATNWLKERGLT